VLSRQLQPVAEDLPLVVSLLARVEAESAMSAYHAFIKLGIDRVVRRRPQRVT
jgi:hypothetical protein